MNRLGTFTENFFSTVKMLGKSPLGSLRELPSGTLAGASGLPSAGENYALFSQGSSITEIDDVLSFFKERGLPFVVPQLPWLDKDFCAALESRGLPVRLNYTAMSLRTDHAEDPSDSSIVKISEKKEMVEWAETAWAGFGGELPVSGEFYSLTDYFGGRSENNLFLLRENGEAACTALLHNSGVCGLYYFATRPEFRRRKLAHRLMKTLMWQALQYSDEMVLLATEEGLPFYLNFGFIKLANVPIRSFTSDI